MSQLDAPATHPYAGGEGFSAADSYQMAAAPPPAAHQIEALVNQVAWVVVGDPAAIRLAVAACLASGHRLLEDIPGVGKPLLAKALAISIGGTFGRVQGTADLLPSDLTGVSVYEEDTRQW